MGGSGVDPWDGSGRDGGDECDCAWCVGVFELKHLSKLKATFDYVQAFKGKGRLPMDIRA